MSALRTVRIRLPGTWQDGWLYKEYLILWARNGEVYFVPISDLVRSIAAATSPGLSAVSEYLVFRNDWKASEQFARILEVPGVRDCFVSAFPDTTLVVDIDLEAINYRGVGSEPIPGVVLDVAIYANRMFAASTEGLYESYFHSNRPDSWSPVVQRLDFRTSHVTASYAVVNGSAGENGLWYAPIIFESEPWLYEDPDNQPEFEQVADVSMSTSFASRHLLNYTTDPFPAFLRSEARRERLHPRADFEEWRVLGYERPVDISALTIAAIETSHRTSLSQAFRYSAGPTQDRVSVLGNSGYRLLVARADSLHVIDLSAFDSREIEAKPDRQFRLMPANHVPIEESMGTYAVGAGFLVELFSEIRLITPRGAYTIFREPAARIRTFMQSRRYKDAILVVEEDGISLLGFFEAV